MGDWYAALKENTKLLQDSTDRTDKTSKKGVLSVLSVHDMGKTGKLLKSGIQKPPNQKSAEMIILDAVNLNP